MITVTSDFKTGAFASAVLEALKQVVDPDLNLDLSPASVYDISVSHADEGLEMLIIIFENNDRKKDLFVTVEYTDTEDDNQTVVEQFDVQSVYISRVGGGKNEMFSGTVTL